MPSPYLEVFRSRRLAVILRAGFSSGLPLALTGGTLQAWMTVEGVDLSTIGIFTLVGFLHLSSLGTAMDRFVPAFLDGRRGWLLVTQVALAVGIAGMAFLSPRSDLVAIAWLRAFRSLRFGLAGHRRRRLPHRRGKPRRARAGRRARCRGLSPGDARIRRARAGSGRRVGLDPGSRVGQHLPSHGALMAVGVLAVLWGEEPSTAPAAPRTLREAVIEPLREYFSRPKAGWILVLLVLYKLGDAFAGSLTTAFLLRGAGFSLEDVGYVNKAVGLAATIIRSAVRRRVDGEARPLSRASSVFGILQAVSILAFMGLHSSGRAIPSWCLRSASRICLGHGDGGVSWRC